jgi:UDP-GlcNAc:undecaprenyl-phosphate GlcNAc-1-phosphate transferase
MNGTLVIWGIVAFLSSLAFTPAAAWIARRFGVLDYPRSERKVHDSPRPLLGGLAPFASVAVCVLVLLAIGNGLTGGEITTNHYAGFLIGGLILMIGGFLDDRFNLPPKFSFVAPFLAAACAVAFGIEIDKLTNPFGGVIVLLPWQSDAIVFVWLLVVMYVTKFLDGLDGLSASVSGTGALMVMLLALTPAYFQPDVALLAAVALGSLLGFLVHNFHPAKIFLGEGGSTFVGFLLGTLAVISGGKLATALLVIGIPLLDTAWVILRRLREGGPSRIFKADRLHLHHRLLDLGWGQRRIVLTYVAFSLAFGGAALFLQSHEKLVALGILAALMLIAAAMLVLKRKPYVAS